MSTPIWINNPTILLKHKYLKDIWATSNMTPEEKINAITRLIILLTTMGYLLTLSTKILYLAILTIILIIILYYIQKNKSKKIAEKFSNKILEVYPSLTTPEEYELNKNKYSTPSSTNPLMNVLLPEIYYEPERKPAAPTYNSQVESDINKSVKKFVQKEFGDKNIDKKLFHDLGDKLAFDRSMISFNGTANTQVPNDQTSFQEYLYGGMISGKEGNPTALERTNGGAYNYKLL